MKKTETETFEASDQRAWRNWLKKNHDSKSSIWLVFHKKDSGLIGISYKEAVEEALCFGWIDSTKRSLNEKSSIQLFTRRKQKSVWSRINKAKVKKLIGSGLMTGAGLRSIAMAKKNGSWTILNDVEKLKIPADLESAFKQNKGSKEFFSGLSRSVRKMMLQWIVLAKRPETRKKRILEIATQAAKKQKPAQFR